MLSQIQEIIEGISYSYGDDFFHKVTLTLNKVVAADYTFIARVDKAKQLSKTDVLVANGIIVENFEYSLKNTPCAKVVDNTVCYYPKDVCSFFPDDQLLIDMNIRAYIGTPLLDSKHQVIGLIVALFKTDQQDIENVSTLFKLFSGRIAAEFERVNYESSLEEKINERTEELQNTLEQLQVTQTQLVDSEKMSALGSLVAGVSHEVNTPLGIAITTHSLVADELRSIQKKLANKTLTSKDMHHFCDTSDRALLMQGENLLRAKKLIENFKKTAADQHQLDIEKLRIGEYYQQVLSTLRSLLKPYAVTLNVICEKSIVIATYPGIHAQILTNLVSNSAKHGFFRADELPDDEARAKQCNTITIEIKQLKPHEVDVIYQDNGTGLSDEAKRHVFEPFFTTARSRGGIGLGMSIVYNLICQKLHGTLTIKPAEQGACFHYTFKESIINLDTDT